MSADCPFLSKISALSSQNSNAPPAIFDGADRNVHSTRMDEMRASQDEMRREMEGLHAQNQLLLSKISALSSQNSNAPGIFDGADRRKLESKQEKQRREGQKITPSVRRRQLAFFDTQCEFFQNCEGK